MKEKLSCDAKITAIQMFAEVFKLLALWQIIFSKYSHIKRTELFIFAQFFQVLPNLVFYIPLSIKGLTLILFKDENIKSMR